MAEREEAVGLQTDLRKSQARSSAKGRVGMAVVIEPATADLGFVAEERPVIDNRILRVNNRGNRLEQTPEVRCARRYTARLSYAWDQEGPAIVTVFDVQEVQRCRINLTRSQAEGWGNQRC